METLKISFEIGGEKIIVETDAANVDSSFKRAKTIAKVILGVENGAVEKEVKSKRGRKPGSKNKEESASTLISATEKKPSGRKRGRPAKNASALAETPKEVVKSTTKASEKTAEVKKGTPGRKAKGRPAKRTVPKDTTSGKRSVGRPPKSAKTTEETSSKAEQPSSIA